MEWITAQPDYDPVGIMYENTVFGYDPANACFQEVTNTFWRRYSLEKDSWRDQPLWSYVVGKHKVTPMHLDWRRLYDRQFQNKGHHHYESDQDINRSSNTRDAFRAGFRTGT